MNRDLSPRTLSGQFVHFVATGLNPSSSSSLEAEEETNVVKKDSNTATSTVSRTADNPKTEEQQKLKKVPNRSSSTGTTGAISVLLTNSSSISSTSNPKRSSYNYYQYQRTRQVSLHTNSCSTAMTPNSTGSDVTPTSNNPLRASSIASDDSKHITVGRKLARLLQRFSWYYPSTSTQETPANLEEGWCYFEHVTLPRYVLRSNSNATTTATSIVVSENTCSHKLHKYICGSSHHTTLDRAEPGDTTQTTRLYPVWHTPLSQMGDFGIGIGLYFTTLKVLGVLCLLAGIITLPNILYYSSTNYSTLGQSSSLVPNLLTLGSAICTDTPWVICQDCTAQQFLPKGNQRQTVGVGDTYNSTTSTVTPDIRFASTCLLSSTSTTTTKSTYCTIFIKKNNCLGAQKKQGLINLSAFLFVFVAMFFLNFYVRRKAIEFDEDEQTAQDYSVLVRNPPPDAYDPEEWRKYFQQTLDDEDVHVTVCTVVVANDLLLQTLHELRDKKRQLHEMLLLHTQQQKKQDINHHHHQEQQKYEITNNDSFERDYQQDIYENINHNNVSKVVADIIRNSSTIGRALKAFLRNTLGCGWDIPSLYERTLVLEHRARGLAQLQHPVSKVFVTLETEGDQRSFLERLSYGKFQIWKNERIRRQQERQTQTSDQNPANANNRWKRPRRTKTTVVPEEYLFRGKYALLVTEPAEPSAVRWENLDDTTESQIISLCITTFVCLCAVVLIAYIVKLCRDRDPALCAFAIAFFNAIFPLFAKAMTNIESHTDEGQKQRSLYIKIAVFRWVNTAIVIFIITPFTTSISASRKSLINQVCAVFIAEILTANVLQYIDIGGQIQRHYFAPRAADQEKMNMCFRGTPYDLAERYTTLTKILFLAFFYSTIFPATYFFAAVAFFVNYCVDKFSILRIWAAAPRLGTQVSEFSRKYFLNGCVIALAFMSSYMLSAFPYDNLCAAEGSSTTAATYQAYVGSDPITIEIEAGSEVYKFCNQNLLSMGVFPALSMFQPLNGHWMTTEQEFVIDIYGWTSVAVLSFFVVVFFWRFGRAFGSFFYGGYKPHGQDMNRNFSEISVIDSYVPQLKSVQYTYPLIACNIDNIDESLMSWKDPSKPYDYYNLTKDIEEIFRGTNLSAHEHAFSKIAHWPP